MPWNSNDLQLSKTLHLRISCLNCTQHSKDCDWAECHCLCRLHRLLWSLCHQPEQSKPMMILSRRQKWDRWQIHTYGGENFGVWWSYALKSASPSLLHAIFFSCICHPPGSPERIKCSSSSVPLLRWWLAHIHCTISGLRVRIHSSRTQGISGSKTWQCSLTNKSLELTN